MTTRHPAFQVTMQPKRHIDHDPHTITAAERAQIQKALEHGHATTVFLSRKLLRLYDERTAACQHLMGLRETPDPEMG